MMFHRFTQNLFLLWFDFLQFDVHITDYVTKFDTNTFLINYKIRYKLIFKKTV